MDALTPTSNCIQKRKLWTNDATETKRLTLDTEEIKHDEVKDREQQR